MEPRRAWDAHNGGVEAQNEGLEGLFYQPSQSDEEPKVKSRLGRKCPMTIKVKTFPIWKALSRLVDPDPHYLSS